MHTGFRYHLGMAALFLLWRIDTFLLNAQASRHEVGLYVVAVTTAEALYLVTDSVAQVSLPRQLEGTLAEAAAFTARITRLNTLVATAAGLGIVALGPVLVPLVFGGDYGGSVGPLLALVPGVVALGLIRPITPILVRLNRPLRVSLFCSLALLLNVALNFALIPVAGAVGAATASSVAYAALAVAYVRWLISATSLELSELWPTRSDIGSLRWRTLRTRTARSAPLPPETRPAAESGVEG
jgi:O-antigen/teichoic acid export membrane protein